jgi:phytoene dehydrogenase-like protein
MPVKYDAIVIGAGPNGLVAAITLARRRKKVLVLEAASEIGGHTRTVEFAPGYRTPLNEDTGWVPDRIERITGTSKLQRAGGGVSMSVATPDGALLHLPARLSAATENIARLSAKDAARWPAFVQRMQKFAELLGLLYQLTPPDIDTSSAREVLPLLGVGRRLRALGRVDMTEFLRVMPMPAQDLLDDTFENESLKAAMAAASIRDLRQGPRSGGTTYNLLHYMVGAAPGSVRGRPWFAESPDAFAKTAAAMAQKRKVEIRTDAPVARITATDGAVTGVVLGNGEEIEAKRVLSTADPKRTLLQLAEPAWLDPEFMLAVRNVKLRGSTAFVCYAVDRVVDDTLKSYTTTVSLTTTTAKLEQAADAAKYGELSAEPHVEIFSPTLRWPTLAPDGKHIVVARVQYAPYALKKGSWDAAQSSEVEKKATAAISRVVQGFESTVKHRKVYSPADLERDFGVTEGALTHGELTLDQILFMRPVAGWGRYAMPIAGLYLGGAGAHPGPGILGGAGYLAAKALLRDL